MDPKTDTFLEALDPVLATLHWYCKNQATCTYCPFYVWDTSCRLKINNVRPNSYMYTAEHLYEETKS